MNIEIQVALNFLISFLYNKLPRRRVNQFAEELETILKCKFNGHWYPDEPYKGSAYRCIHCNPQLDSSLFREAAHNSGLNLKDVQENLPHELSIWIDPGEVSYRISEKSQVNILYSSKRDCTKANAEMGLNPEAQCFQPIESTNGMNMFENRHRQMFMNSRSNDLNNFKRSNPLMINPVTPINSVTTFNQKNDPITFTTAAFAATKFGSTKPKVQVMKKYQPQQLQQQKNGMPEMMAKQQYRRLSNNNIILQNKPSKYNNSFNSQNYQQPRNMINGWNSSSAAISPPPSLLSAAIETPNNFNNCSPYEAINNKIEYAQLSNQRGNFQGFDQDLTSTTPKMAQTNGYVANTEQLKPETDDNLNLFENIPLIMSDQLLREIFDSSSNPNELNDSGVPNSNGADLTNNPNGFMTMVMNDCSPNFTISSSSWSSNELSSPINIINEFDNLSLNSNSSSSFGSVSSYVT